jgi:tetratricopeptide (TPR) repeat protein
VDNNKRTVIVGAGLLAVIAVVLWLAVGPTHWEIDEQQAERSLQSGISLFDQDKFKEAIEVLQQVPAGSVQESRARYYEGSAHMMLGDYETAIEKLQEAQGRTPSDPPTLFALGVASYKLGNIKLARGYFNSVLAINPMDKHEQDLWDQARGLVDIMARLDRDPGSVAPPGVHGASAQEPPPLESTATAEDKDGPSN